MNINYSQSFISVSDYRVTSCYHHNWQPCFRQHFATLGHMPGTSVTYNNMHRRNKMINYRPVPKKQRVGMSQIHLKAIMGNMAPYL